MGKTVQKESEQNSSEEHSLNNGTMESHPNWSRCNSFSSSSNDSSVFCASYLPKPNYHVEEKLPSEENSNRQRKRRNSSGSSASSNLSCISDKDIKKMPVLISSEAISSVDGPTGKSIGNLTNFSNINTSTLTLQHKTLFGNNIPRSIGVDSVLPFRHNLRRNIRRKTCSCDCTATCTTYRVRQYNGILEETVEEQTVISRTEVKTCVERSTAELSPVKLSSDISYKKSTPKNECNRKRRSEIQQLYASLSEIKWAKNFSPDNILRQFDVRQAASCSVFGRSPEDKSLSSNKRSPKRSRLNSNNHRSTPTKKTNRDIKLNKFDLDNPNSYSTRSKNQLPSTNTASVYNVNSDSSFPVLEKNVSANKSSLKINSDPISTYSFPSEEEMKLKTALTNQKNSLNGNCLPNLNSIQNQLSSCNTVDHIPKKFLNFDFKSQSNVDAIESVTDFSPSFLDIAEERIRTIDACFREVGAEVVVSACFETKYELPHLTSSETHSIEDSCNMNDNPPVLEPLLSTQSYNPDKLSSSICYDAVHQDHDNSSNCELNDNYLSSTSKKSNIKFFPSIDSKSLPEKDYSPSLTCFDEISTNSKLSLTHLPSTGETNLLKRETAVCDDPPVLELCINISDQNYPQKVKQKIRSRQKSVMVKNNSNCIVNKIVKKEVEMQPKSGNKSYNLSRHFHGVNSTNNHLQISRSLIIEAGRRIFNKYLKFARSNSEKKLPVINNAVSINGFKKHSKFISLSSNNKELFTLNKNSQSTISPKVSSFQKHFHEIPCPTSDSVKRILKVSSHKSQRTSEFFNKEDDNSVSIQLSQSTSDSVSLPHETKIVSLESHQQTIDSVDTVQNTTVIKTFNQKISYSKSPEKVNLNHDNSSSFVKQKKFYQPKKKAVKCFKESTQKSLIDCHSSASASTSNWINKPFEKTEHPAKESVEVPSRVFTCQYRTIKIIHGNNYIQIILKTNSGNSIFLTHESLMELKRAICKAASDKDCRLLILNGYGKTFCLGLDLSPIIGEYKIHAVGEIANAVKDLITTLATFHKPLVAIVNGAAFGLGMTILNHADIIIATENASFCMPYSKLGYMPEGGATVTLPEAIGTTRAMDLLLKGNTITAEQAKSIGLVNEVVSLKNLPRDLVSCVRDMAERSLSTMETTKAMMKMHLRARLLEALESEVKLLPQMWLSPSCQESILSALESGLLTEWTKH